MKNAKDYIYQYEPLWGEWYIDSLIGKGNYGSVYKITRDNWGCKQTSAVKVIYVEPNNNEIKNLELENFDEKSIKTYYKEKVQGIIKEIKILYKLKGCNNIISYEDHMIIEEESSLEWIILIRMEYINPLSDYLLKNVFIVEDIVQLGIDICSGLELCNKYNIIHRDIKEENIFVSKDKVFKIGDFGISKELLNNTNMSSTKGTPYYMAPEALIANKYDERSDIYSLGIVLYKLLNYGRMPFLPVYPEVFTEKDRKKAFEKRMAASHITPPVLGDVKLKNIILKACMYNPEGRYKSAADMKKDLVLYLKALTGTFTENNFEINISNNGDVKSDNNDVKSEVKFIDENNILSKTKKVIKNHKKLIIFTVTNFFLLLIFLFIIYSFNYEKHKVSAQGDHSGKNNYRIKSFTDNHKINLKDTPSSFTSDSNKNSPEIKYSNRFYGINSSPNNSDDIDNSIIVNSSPESMKTSSPSPTITTLSPFIGIWRGNIINSNNQKSHYVKITIASLSGNNVYVEISKQDIESNVIVITETGTSAIEGDDINVITESYKGGELHSRSSISIILVSTNSISVNINRKTRNEEGDVFTRFYEGNLSKLFIEENLF